SVSSWSSARGCGTSRRSSTATPRTSKRACPSSSRGSSATAIRRRPSGPPSSRERRSTPMSKRNPMMDKVAIVGLGSSKYGRNLEQTPLELGMEAAIKAIKDAGVKKEDIDGVIGGGLRTGWDRDANYLALIEGLGLNGATYVQQSWLGSCLVY